MSPEQVLDKMILITQYKLILQVKRCFVCKCKKISVETADLSQWEPAIV